MPDAQSNLGENMMKLGDIADAWATYARERAYEMMDDDRIKRGMLQMLAGGLSLAAGEARRIARTR